MSVPELGPISSDTLTYMYAVNAGTIYVATLVFTEGQALPNLIFDPRLPTGASVSFTPFINATNIYVRNTISATGNSVGYVNGVLDITNVPADVIMVTTSANDDFAQNDNIAVLASVPYSVFRNGSLAFFNAYIPGTTPGTIKTDSNGKPLIQTISGNFYFYTLTWFPLSNCSVTLSDQATIINFITNWLTNGSMPGTQYFTTSSECNVQNVYTYCSFRTNCTSSCNGPCTNPSNTCTFSSNGYYCPNSNNNSTDMTPFYIILAFLLVFLIAVIILLFLK